MKRLHCCAECGAVLTDPDEIAERLCDACIRAWYCAEMDKLAGEVIAAIGVPTRALRETRVS